MFGFQRRFVRRCEWLTRMPTRGRLPHTSQTADMGPRFETDRRRQDTSGNSENGIYAVHVSSSRRYVGGEFSVIGGASQPRFAQFSGNT